MRWIADLPNVLSLLLWGFAATVVMTTIMYGSQVAGLSRLSLPFLVGTCLTANRDRANVLGFVVYLIGGWVFAVVYAALFAALGDANGWEGALIGLIHGLFLLVVVLPVMPHFHPRMASEYEGADDVRRLEPPGFLGLNYGYRTPFTTLLAQTAYGFILGAFLPR
ncbi:hypothetical protein SAMN05216338_1018107 [Bradyrhizobium sp. Rc2d]|nr:hypothetical protein SAMN05216338_1018107 [Bradyrhizobium sp. Rc2d]